MSKSRDEKEGSCCGRSGEGDSGKSKVRLPSPPAQGLEAGDDDPCCGPKQAPSAGPYERPGYVLSHFVDGFLETKVGPVPRLRHRLSILDYIGIIRARLGFLRDEYKVSPGLYCVGAPNADSPVLVTANYKLTLDGLREDTLGLSAWVLVLDTRGVNVWCAAGKKNFSTSEVVRWVEDTNLRKLVSHRELILPQLGGVGVSSHLVKKGCSFKVLWGPVKSSHIIRYLKNGKKGDDEMRCLTFTLYERMVLVPVEISLILKPSLYTLFAIFALSAINSQFFSLDLAMKRGVAGAASLGAGVFSGAVLVPALLPLIPFRSFYLKGILVGLGFGILIPLGFGKDLLIEEKVALLLLTTTVSSHVAMNFTGTTPYTSPSGVEKEMRRGIPLQLLSLISALFLWVWGGFMR